MIVGHGCSILIICSSLASKENGARSLEIVRRVCPQFPASVRQKRLGGGTPSVPAAQLSPLTWDSDLGNWASFLDGVQDAAIHKETTNALVTEAVSNWVSARGVVRLLVGARKPNESVLLDTSVQSKLPSIGSWDPRPANNV